MDRAMAWWKRLSRETKLKFVQLHEEMKLAQSPPFGFVMDRHSQQPKVYTVGALPEGKSAQPFGNWCYRVLCVCALPCYAALLPLTSPLAPPRALPCSLDQDKLTPAQRAHLNLASVAEVSSQQGGSQLDEEEEFDEEEEEEDLYSSGAAAAAAPPQAARKPMQLERGKSPSMDAFLQHEFAQSAPSSSAAAAAASSSSSAAASASSSSAAAAASSSSAAPSSRRLSALEELSFWGKRADDLKRRKTTAASSLSAVKGDMLNYFKQEADRVQGADMEYLIKSAEAHTKLVNTAKEYAEAAKHADKELVALESKKDALVAAAQQECEAMAAAATQARRLLEEFRPQQPFMQQSMRFAAPHSPGGAGGSFSMGGGASAAHRISELGGFSSLVGSPEGPSRFGSV